MDCKNYFWNACNLVYCNNKLHWGDKLPSSFETFFEIGEYHEKIVPLIKKRPKQQAN